MSELQPPDTPDPFDGMESGDVLDFKRDHFANLLPESEREAFYAWLDDEQTEAYADGRRDEQEQLASALPGTYYMDPPDGGDVEVLEQLQRMAKDAELGRRQREHQEAAAACIRRSEA